MNQTISIINSFLKSVPINPGDKILAAVSGGADSVAMLHLLCSTADPTAAASASEPISITGDSYLIPQSKIENRKSTIICAHINHRLRDKESDQDQAFVTNLCADWNIPLYVEQIDVKAYAVQEKLSIETAARQLRLEALERIARQTGCKFIATAHHKDDQAETVLFRLLRGTAFAGLAGIRPTREHHGLYWIRPMLNIRRTQIESYCRQNNTTWRNDASNIETHYRRNWIRHRLLPYLQQESKTDLTEKLAALAQSALTLQQHIESVTAQILQKSLTQSPDDKSQSGCHAHARVGMLNAKTGNSYLVLENLSIIKQAGPFVAGEILRNVLTRLNCGLRDISLPHYQKFFHLLDKTRGTLQLPGGCTIRKKNDILTFETSSCSTAAPGCVSIELPLEGTTKFADWSIQTRILQITKQDLGAFRKQQNNFTQWFDYKQLQSPLIVRCRRNDDTFTPFGRKTQKKITRFLTDSQIDEKLRESCFIIEDKIGILWLAPIRRSTLAPVTEDIADVLEVRIGKM